MSEHTKALQQLRTVLWKYFKYQGMDLLDKPIIPEPIDPGHPVHSAVVEVEKHYGGKLPIEGGAWEAWRWLLWYSRVKGKESISEQAGKAYWFAEELWNWAKDTVKRS